MEQLMYVYICAAAQAGDGDSLRRRHEGLRSGAGVSAAYLRTPNGESDPAASGGDEVLLYHHTVGLFINM